MKMRAVLTQDELILFCKEMYLILSSSISIVEGLESVIEGMPNKEAQKALRVSLVELECNKPLSYALDMSNLFTPYMISMIEIGEKTGKVDQVMDSLGKYYEKDQMLKKQIKSGTVYPLVIAGMVTVIIGVMVTKVLPIFANVFENLGGNIPSSVDFVTGVGRFIVGLVLLAFVMVLVTVASIFLLYRSEEGREKARKFFLSMPKLSNIYQSYQTAQFANSLSLLVSSGYDLHSGLELTEKIIEDKSFKERIKTALSQLDAGEPLYRAFEQMKIFKGIHSQVLKLSVQTGHLDSVLAELSDKYTSEVDESISTLIGVIEPTLVGATSFIIGGILLTVMLPLISIMSSIG